MKKLTLHLGMHRCASTTVQNLLRANRCLLAERGVGVVLRADMEAKPALDMRRWHRRSGFDPRAKGAMLRFADAVDAVPETHVIISEENLVGTMPGALDRRFYPHFERFLARLTPLRERFDLQLRVVARQQDRFLESVYAFRVARGLKEDFDSFLASFSPASFDWRKLSNVLDKHGLAEQSRIAMMDDWQGRALNHHLAELVNLDSEGLILRSRGNPSVPTACLPLLLAVNRAGLMMDRAVRKSKLLPLLTGTEMAEPGLLAGLLSGQEIADVDRRFESRIPTGFSAAGRTSFMAQYQKANSAFLNHACIIGASRC